MAFLQFLTGIVLIVLIVGLVKPELVIRWGLVKTRKRVLLVYGVPLIILSVIGSLGTSSPSKSNIQTVTDSPSEDKAPLAEQPKVGSTLKSDKWEITLNSFKSVKTIKTGNEFLDPAPDPYAKYVILNVTYKNIDDTGRTLTDSGQLYIDYNGKNYEFDKTESILSDGWGLFLESMNPLTKKTTNIVFKVPSEIKGKVFWLPENGIDEKYIAGEIK